MSFLFFLWDEEYKWYWGTKKKKTGNTAKKGEKSVKIWNLWDESWICGGVYYLYYLPKKI